MQVEDFTDLSTARDVLLKQQQFHEAIDPTDENFDHAAFERQHEVGGSPNLDAIAEAVRRQHAAD